MAITSARSDDLYGKLSERLDGMARKRNVRDSYNSSQRVAGVAGHEIIW